VFFFCGVCFVLRALFGVLNSSANRSARASAFGLARYGWGFPPWFFDDDSILAEWSASCWLFQRSGFYNLVEARYEFVVLPVFIPVV